MASRLNILYLGTWYPHPADNGYKIRVLYLLRSLAARHDVTFLSFAFGTAQSQERSVLHDWCSTVQVVTLDPFAFNRRGILRTFIAPRPLYCLPIPAMAQLVASSTESQRFDTIIASTLMMADYTRNLPKSVTKVLEEHNSMTRWMHERFLQQKGLLGRMRCWVSWHKTRRHESAVLRRFDLVTMVCEQDAATTRSLLPTDWPPVSVVPNGVDCTLNRPGLAAHIPDTLVFNGSLTYRVNFDSVRWFLTEVYPHIKRGRPTVNFVVTGSVDGIDLSGLPLDNSIRLTGLLRDVRPAVAQATVCVAPIWQGGGTRLKILEAMAIGTPVVATSKAAEGLQVSDGEHLLLADTPQAFAEKTLLLLKNADLRSYLAINARKLVEREYDWERIGDTFVTVVEQAVQRKASNHTPVQ